MYTTGLALLILALFLWLIDFKAYKRWAQPFIVFGVNSLFAYIFSIVWVKLLFIIKLTADKGDLLNAYNWIYQCILVPIAGNMNGSLLFAILHILFFWSILLVLYKKKIFIKV